MGGVVVVGGQTWKKGSRGKGSSKRPTKVSPTGGLSDACFPF